MLWYVWMQQGESMKCDCRTVSGGHDSYCDWHPTNIAKAELEDIREHSEMLEAKVRIMEAELIQQEKELVSLRELHRMAQAMVDIGMVTTQGLRRVLSELQGVTS